MSEAIDRMSTTEDVRDAYIESAFEGYEQEAAEAFDRWLAAHDAEIRTDRWRARDVERELAKAWDEGWITRNFCAIALSGSVRPTMTNPYRTDVPQKDSK